MKFGWNRNIGKANIVYQIFTKPWIPATWLGRHAAHETFGYKNPDKSINDTDAIWKCVAQKDILEIKNLVRNLVIPLVIIRNALISYPFLIIK